MKKFLLIMVALISLFSFGPRPAAAAPKWPIPEGIKTIEVNGYDMAYQETGNGIPLVLIHGAVNDYRVWTIQVPEFSKTYRTIAISLRHSYPEKWKGGGNDFSVTQDASDVAALIKSLNLGKVHLLGHSRGGAVALNVAMLYPGVIRTLTLADASGLEALLPETPEEAQKRLAGVKAFSDNLRGILVASDFEKAARVFVDSVYGPGAWEKVPAEQKQIYLDNIATAPEIGGRPKVSCGDIQKFTFPVLLLNGERSPKRYSAMFSAMRQCKPNIPTPIIVPNAAHRMQHDNPEFFNKAVLDFLNQY
jgi:pimeloyl-ACP methyl ester carboxylesterase